MAGAEIVERIVAVVNEEIITLSELRAISIPYLQKMKQQYSVDYGEEQIIETEKRIVDQLIDEMLVAQEADRLGIEVTPKEINMAMRDVKERNQLTEAQFEEALAEDGMTLEDYKKELTKQMKKMRLMDQEIKAKVQVSKKEIDEYYQEHKGEFNAPPEVRLQQILLILPPRQLKVRSHWFGNRQNRYVIVLMREKILPCWSNSILKIQMQLPVGIWVHSVRVNFFLPWTKWLLPLRWER